MGPRQFHNDFVGRDTYDLENGKGKHNIGDIHGDVGVDVSGLFYRKMGTVRGAAPIDMTPPVPLFEAINAVMKDLRTLVERGRKKSPSSLMAVRIR